MPNQPSTLHNDFPAPRRAPPADAWSSDLPSRSPASSSAGGLFSSNELPAELARLGELLASFNERLARIESHLHELHRELVRESNDLLSSPVKPSLESSPQAFPTDLHFELSEHTAYPTPELHLP